MRLFDTDVVQKLFLDKMKTLLNITILYSVPNNAFLLTIEHVKITA